MTNNKHTGKEEYVRYEDGTRVLLDEDDSPALTDKELVNASFRPARDILPDAFFKALEEGRVGRPKSLNPKKPVTVRLDADIVEWLRSQKGYNILINEVLRKQMQERL